MDNTEVKTKKKGTAKTEALIGTSVNKLGAAHKAIQEALKPFNELATEANRLSEEVADKQDKIASLNVEYTEKKRQHEVQLKMDVQANVEQVVGQHLQVANKTAVPTNEWLSLQEQLRDLKVGQDKAIDKAVAIATISLKREYESQTAVREAQYTAKEADNKAQIGSLNTQVAALQKESSNWQAQLNSERDASVKRAQASSIGTLQVGTNNGK